MKLVFVCVLLAIAFCVVAEPVYLTKKNFDSLVRNSGKSAIVAFKAPWCGHCKHLKPDWDKLGAEYEGSSSVIIGEVDCTEEGELCQEFAIQGYPTIKYFTKETPKDGEAYNQGRSLEALRTFVKDNLEVKCDVEDPTGCTPKEVSFITAMKAKSNDEIKAQLKRLNGMQANKMKAS